jgi:cytochrome b subunit of formate dehydrogenase
VSLITKDRIKRFSPLQRIFHVLLLLAFLNQGATGLSRLFMKSPWGQWLGWVFGGYEYARVVHIYGGIFLLCAFAIHVIYLLFKIDWHNFPSSLLGPDSMMPRLKDFKDFFQHTGWFLGIKQAPVFDRWSYWEKFDYWAVFWGMVILGGTGLLLTYQLASTRFMPGWGLNVALWIHRIEAILAMAHVFVIHFFVAHLRRHNFPMDRSIFEGSASLDATLHEKKAWTERLEKSGKLEGALVSEAAAGKRIIYYIFGYAAVAAGLFLLVGALVNTSYIAW